MKNKSHPYKKLSDKAFWTRSVAKLVYSEIDPVGVFNLKITPETKVSTAGSCFAQHIARHLRNSGFKYYVVEDGHSIIPVSIKEKYHYGVFSARYGNIYTSRQLLQLLYRAYGRFIPIEDVWIESDGAVIDPYRPTVEPNGFISVAEMYADRAQHLAAVRKMFETLDVFVFTLGLTECWMSNIDGAVFPLCPGVEGGQFDSERHIFHNLDVSEVVGDMSEFVLELHKLNPSAQLVLTVSPVPLMATAEPGDHVLSATTYSKSVLRVAAECLRKKFENVHYFPSFEIITGNFSRGQYYGQDLRSVTEEGVSHVMHQFLKHATCETMIKRIPETNVENLDVYLNGVQAIVDVECDESSLDK